MIMKILAWVLGIVILVGAPLLLDEQGLGLAGVAVLAYTVWGVRNGKRGS